ncbi:MAG: 4-hydroxybenzoyl-CoA thioesterase family active site, partial [uncultured Rubrobacteraceae bacterium]
WAASSGCATPASPTKTSNGAASGSWSWRPSSTTTAPPFSTTSWSSARSSPRRAGSLCASATRCSGAPSASPPATPATPACASPAADRSGCPKRCVPSPGTLP